MKTSIEIGKISEWFQVSKLTLYKDKPRSTFFRKLRDTDNLPVQLPVLKIDNYKIERTSSITFLAVMVDEHLIWKDHLIENELSRNLGLLCKANNFQM